MATLESEEKIAVSKLNPWTSVWISPRKTVRHAIEHKLLKFVTILSIFTGIFYALDRAVVSNVGNDLSMMNILLMCFIAGGIGGIVGLWIHSGVFYYIGKWIGGKGSFEDMRLAVGISYIPLSVGLIIWIIDLFVLGDALFSDMIEISIGQSIWSIFSGIIVVVFWVWSVFILIKGIAVVHRFSSWKGLLTVILPVVAIFILLIFI